jgi:hypothetical protein
MISFNNNKFVKGFFTLLAFTAIWGCAKKDYRPGFPEGTTFPTIHLNGYTLDRMQVRVGPRSVIAGYVTEEISDVTYEVPFGASQDVNRVVFYKEDGSAPYTGSQIRFNTPTRDTTVKVFYDGKTFVQNPIFETPATGKMGLRINFQSLYSSYKGPVDLELHEIYDIKFTKINPATGLPYKDSKGNNKLFDTTLVRPAVAFLFRNLKSTEFNAYSEISAPPPRPKDADGNPRLPQYAFFVRKANTSESLQYPANVTPPITSYTVPPTEVIDFIPDHNALLTIKDNILEFENPKRVNYLTKDRTELFQ